MQKLYEKLRVDAQRHRLAAAASGRPRSLHAQRNSAWPAARIRREPAGSATTPPTSVLDRNCKAHELDNLYVVDTSFFVSIGAVNPSLTAIANALRVGDHLRQRLG